MSEVATITDEEALEQAFAGDGPRWLLKHSNACGISSGALAQVESYARDHDDPIHVLVIQEHRPLSNEVARRTGRTHQSPQLFLLDDGEVRWHATHWSITAEAMEEARAGLG